jgi:hypothetical protein
MATSHPLHPIAEERLAKLAAALEREFGRTDSERKIVNALVYGATAAQTAGMLEAFAKHRKEYNEAHEDEVDGAAARAIGGK